MTFFDDMLTSGVFDPKRPPQHARPKPEAKPLPQIRGRQIEGVLYVRAVDVADALESQAPRINARLIARLRRS